MKNSITKYHNDLNTVALRKFNSVELDLFISICTQMKDKETKIITFNFEDLKDLAEFSSTDTRDLIKYLDTIYKKLIETSIKLGDEKKWTRFVLFNEFTIDTLEKYVSIQINDKFKWILNEISSNFTKFELKEFVNLKSSYSKECYRRLKQYRFTGVWKVNIEDLRYLLDIPETYRMTDIDARVLRPIKNELGDIFENLNIEKIKSKSQGRAIKSLKFTFKPEKNVKERTYKKPTYLEKILFEKLKQKESKGF